MRRRWATTFGALVILGTISCGDGTDPAELDGTMHATIVGSADPWDAEKSLTATMINGNLEIVGVENSSVTITLKIFDAAVGSFSAMAGDQVPEVEATYGDTRSFSYGSVVQGGSADVTITELTDTKAVGTFSFVAGPVIFDLQGTSIYRITNGTFNVTLR